MGRGGEAKEGTGVQRGDEAGRICRGESWQLCAFEKASAVVCCVVGITAISVLGV